MRILYIITYTNYIWFLFFFGCAYDSDCNQFRYTYYIQIDLLEDLGLVSQKKKIKEQKTLRLLGFGALRAQFSQRERGFCVLEIVEKRDENGRKRYVYWGLGPLRLWFPSENAIFAF